MATLHLPRPQARPHIPVFNPFGFVAAGLGRVNWWIIGAITMVSLSAMLPVIQRSTATSEGFKVQSTEAEKARLSGEIRTVEQDIAQLTSLARIERRAAEIGLGPGPSPIYITVAEPGPAPANVPAEYLPVPVQHTDGPESWWLSILHGLGLPD